MKKVNFEENFTTTIGGFFQYDYGQIIDVYNTGIDIENLQFEFIQNNQQITVLGEYISETDSYNVRIPDTFLQNPENILCYIYYEDATKGNTIKIIIIRITAREKYEDIPDPEHKGVVEQILEMIANLQEEIDNFTISDEQLQIIIDEVKEACDLNNYYTKTEIDTLLEDKVNVSDLPDMTNYYTKTETYSKSEIDNILGNIESILEEI